MNKNFKLRYTVEYGHKSKTFKTAQAACDFARRRKSGGNPTVNVFSEIQKHSSCGLVRNNIVTAAVGVDVWVMP